MAVGVVLADSNTVASGTVCLSLVAGDVLPSLPSFWFLSVKKSNYSNKLVKLFWFTTSI